MITQANAPMPATTYEISLYDTLSYQSTRTEGKAGGDAGQEGDGRSYVIHRKLVFDRRSLISR